MLLMLMCKYTVDDISVNTVDALDDSPVTDILVGDWW